jgi:hypothetical protein
MVVFGGYGSSSSGPIYLNDVWELSLAGSPAWTQITPAGTPPITRRQHTAIYDPIRDRMVVFGGGTNSIPPNLNDVRSLSLAGSPAWTLLTPAGTPPSARYGHEAIYDPVRDRMVVFGGYNGTSSWNDVWELSLADSPGWTQLAPAGTPPSARYWHRAIYDPVRDHMAVFGGNDGSNNRSDVWYLKWASTVSVPPRSGDDALWLAPAYPNPSRSRVSIGFTLPRASEATLRIYDVSGRVVMTLVDGWLPAGSQTIRWDRRSSSGAFAQPGLYFYELRVNGQKLARRMVLIQ